MPGHRRRSIYLGIAILESIWIKGVCGSYTNRYTLLEGDTSKLGIIMGHFLWAYGIKKRYGKREERREKKKEKEKRCLFGTLDYRIIHQATAGNSRLQHRMSEKDGYDYNRQ